VGSNSSTFQSTPPVSASFAHCIPMPAFDYWSIMCRAMIESGDSMVSPVMRADGRVGRR